MTFNDAIATGNKYLRRKNWAGWIYRVENNFFWKDWKKFMGAPVSATIHSYDELACDWETWDGVVRETTHGPTEFKSAPSSADVPDQPASERSTE